MTGTQKEASLIETLMGVVTADAKASGTYRYDGPWVSGSILPCAGCGTMLTPVLIVIGAEARRMFQCGTCGARTAPGPSWEVALLNANRRAGDARKG